MEPIAADTASLLARVKDLLPALDAEASRLDTAPGFPDEAFAQLREVGALAAPVPRALGGLGLGTEPMAADDALALLRLLGRGSLPVGRLFEGHVNAIRLVMQYGDEGQRRAAARDAQAGHLFGIWVTDGPDPVTFRESGDRLELAGAKMFCSGACHVTRPLITAAPSAGGDPRMLVVPLPLGEARQASPSIGTMHGMRSSETGRCAFGGVRVGREALLGSEGDYLRQPEFSAGAWRGIAVALGGVDRLVDALRDQLVARGREAAPAQRQRVGEALIARETAAMWAGRAARSAEGCSGHAADDVVAIVNLARIAAEGAALDVIRLVQRGLGLAGLLTGNAAERVGRDLATYLRQPAPDETLAEAAAHFTRRDPPGEARA